MKINTIKTMINKNLTSVTNVTGKISGRGHVKTGFLFTKINKKISLYNFYISVIFFIHICIYLIYVSLRFLVGL